MSNFEMFKKLCSFKDFRSDDLIRFLDETHKLKKAVLAQGWESQEIRSPKFVAQVFFESSTRTRVSFEVAAQRLNLRFSHFQMDDSTSRAKGESIYDSLRVIESLSPDLIIFRSKSDPGLDQFFNETKIPFVCAGLGAEFHPTQALLDVFTIQEYVKKDLKDLTILLVGDTKASRVVGSHIELSKLLGYRLLQFSDKNHSTPSVESVSNLDEGLKYADIIMRLRTQKERGSQELDDEFKITSKHLQSGKFLMHPGPFLRGEDFEPNLAEHSQSLIWKQKENGLYVRAMVYKKIWSQS